MGFSSAAAVHTAFVETKEKGLILMFAGRITSATVIIPPSAPHKQLRGLRMSPTPPPPSPRTQLEDEHNGTHHTHNYLPPVLHFLPACHFCIFFFQTFARLRWVGDGFRGVGGGFAISGQLET